MMVNKTYPAYFLRVTDDRISVINTATGSAWGSCHMTARNWADLGELLYKTYAPEIVPSDDSRFADQPIKPRATIPGDDGRPLDITGDPDGRGVALLIPSSASLGSMMMFVPLREWDDLVEHRLSHAEIHGSM